MMVRTLAAVDESASPVPQASRQIALRRMARREIARAGCLIAAAVLAAGGLPRASSAMDYETFANRIRETGAASPEAALALLPEEMRINYTLVHQSRSIQQGSLQNPRVLLFGTDAKLIVAFNGSPDETGYANLEILHFKEESETFELRSIEFGKTVHFSEANPVTCTACHKHSPQPIWKDYGSANDESEHGQWPGTYGPSHDMVSTELKPALLAFWEAAPRHPRYRLLLRDPESDLFPYQPTEEKFRWQHRFRPNNRLSRLLARLDARRVARAMEESELFQGRKNLLLAWLLECDEWQSDPGFAEEVRHLFAARFPEADHAALYADLRSVSPEDRYVIPFMLEKLFMGLDAYQWNMSVVTPPANRYHEGIQTIDQLVAGRLLERLAGEDAALAPFYRKVTFSEAYGAPLVKVIQPGGAIWPGDIGELYDRSGVYHDLALAKQACPLVVQRARAELGAGPHLAAHASPPSGDGGGL